MRKLVEIEKVDLNKMRQFLFTVFSGTIMIYSYITPKITHNAKK